MVKIKTRKTVEIELTPEEEAKALLEEFNNVMSTFDGEIGEVVRFVKNGTRDRLVDVLGPDHVGRCGVVQGLGYDSSVNVAVWDTNGSLRNVWVDDDAIEVWEGFGDE